MPSSRKARERFFLDRFLGIAGLSPSALTEGESPDFVLELQGRKVGVEVTEIFIEPSAQTLSLRANENMTDRIVSRAREIYHESTRPPVFVSVTFYDAQVSQYLQRDETAAALARLIGTLMMGTDGPLHWRNDYSDSQLGSIAFISIVPGPPAGDGRWSVARAGWVQPLQPSDLAPAVAKKNLRYENYRQRASEVWLLLAIDSSRPSQLFEVDSSLDMSGLGSKFDKTFFVRTFPPVLVRHDRAGSATATF